MPSKIDPYPVLCMLMTMLNGVKRDGYEIIDIFTNQDDDLEFVVSTRSGLRIRAALKVTVKEEKVI